ncbi:DUF5615 family PIN-like protein [Pricia mediterranea]|uniref:DUF5615 family PIN-like protein n=1 Tax=Pricia mediterranea TaxID=3076079 RepID=UPI003D788930
MYSQASQTKELGLTDFSDKKIWDFAKSKGYTIVTFDSDFFDLEYDLWVSPESHLA